MKEEFLLQRNEEQPLLMLAQEPWEGDKQEAGANNDLVVCAGNQLTDADAVDGSFSSTHSVCGDEKTTLRKRICMREGACQWPRPAASGGTAGSPGVLLEPLTPGADLVATDFDTMINSLAPPSMEYLLADGLPTPTSTSSTNASPMGDLNLQLRHMDRWWTTTTVAWRRQSCGARSSDGTMTIGTRCGILRTQADTTTPSPYHLAVHLWRKCVICFSFYSIDFNAW